MISFTVPGVPVAKGSMKGFSRPGMRAAILTDQKERELKPWEATIAALAREAGVPFSAEGPVFVSLSFRFVRPRSHFGTGKNADRLKVNAPHWHTSRPDVDKVTRAVLDALKGVAYHDDSQAQLGRVQKVYAGDTEGGVLVEIGEAS